MRKKYFLTITLIFVFALNTQKVFGNNQIIHKVDLPFIKNEGQLKNNIKFYALSFYGFTGIKKDGSIIYYIPTNSSYISFSEKLSNKSLDIKGIKRSKALINYFIGNKHISNIKTFKSLLIKNVYNGIDVELKIKNKSVEKIFKVKPYINPSSIRVSIHGVKNILISKNGELIIQKNNQSIKFSKPIAFQLINGKKEFVNVSYKKINKTVYSFDVGNYDKSKMLFIDPSINSMLIGGNNEDFAKTINKSEDAIYISGFTRSSNFPVFNGYDNSYNGEEIIYNINYSTEDNSYYDENGQKLECNKYYPEEKKCIIYNRDIFVLKLDKNLNNIISATFIGGSKSDRADKLIIEDNGDILVGGSSYSPDFPVTDNVQGDTADNHGNWDIVLIRLNSNLNKIVKSIKIGGSKKDKLTDLSIDTDSNNIFIYGYTKSDNFPIVGNTFKRSKKENDYDLFILKIDKNLDKILTSTFLGGSDFDRSYKISITSNFIYGIGRTFSSDFATDNNIKGKFKIFNKGKPSDEEHGLIYTDGFIFKMDKNLKNLESFTYIGGSDIDRALDIKVYNGFVYVIGFTSSLDFPTTKDVIREKLKGDILKYEIQKDDKIFNIEKVAWDTFIIKLNLDLTDLVASSLLGGKNNDNGNNLEIDGQGNLYISGFTTSTDFPVTDTAYQTKLKGISNGFITKINQDLNKILYSTYVGGNNHDAIWDLFLEGSDIFILGTTDSQDFKKEISAQKTEFEENDKDKDIFLLKVNIKDGNIITSSKGGGCSFKNTFNLYIYIFIILIWFIRILNKNEKKINYARFRIKT